MGELVPLNDRADLEPGADPIDSLDGWARELRAGVVGRVLSVVLAVEDADGSVYVLRDSALARFDRARALGVLDLAAARMRTGPTGFPEPEA